MTVARGRLHRNAYLIAENRILKHQVNGRFLLSGAEKGTLAEAGYRLGRKALEHRGRSCRLHHFVRHERGLCGPLPASQGSIPSAISP
jgi:hypothetical protein